MNWLTVITTGLVPIVSVISTATVAVWSKRIDARNRRDDREHERVLAYEKRAADDKKAVLKSPISATHYVKRGAQSVGQEVTEEAANRRRTETVRELYDFRLRLGLDDGIAELMVQTAQPVRELTDLMLDEWDRQFREHGYSLTQLDSCKRQLAKTVVDAPPPDDELVYFGGHRRWSDLKKEETAWLDRLGAESDLDVDALVALCDRTLKAATRICAVTSAPNTTDHPPHDERDAGTRRASVVLANAGIPSSCHARRPRRARRADGRSRTVASGARAECGIASCTARSAAVAPGGPKSSLPSERLTRAATLE